MTAARRSGARIGSVRSLVANPMDMIRDGFDVLVSVGVEMGAGLALKTSALNHVEQMRDDAGFDEALAIFVEINSPGVAGAFAKKLKNVFGGMIARHAGVDARALAV